MNEAAAAPVIEARGLKRDFQLGESVVHALRGVSLSVQRGEMTAIMGPSGSGKSTLMHLLGCLDTPSEGTIRIEEEDVSALSETELALVRNRRVGFVFQQFNLLPRINVLENVSTPLLYAGVPARQRRERATEALERVGLADRLRHRPTELSGGQRQRVAVARALVTNPVIILADEPTGNLDSATSVEIMALFQELCRSGITIALVTHEPDIAGFARRVVTMKDGRIISDLLQEPREAIAAPAAGEVKA